MVTSPDNSFIPFGSRPHRAIRIRGVTGVAAQADDTIELPTAGVVVGIYADAPNLARTAAETTVPINDIGAPAASLPPPLPRHGLRRAAPTRPDANSPARTKLTILFDAAMRTFRRARKAQRRRYLASQAAGAGRTAIVIRVTAHR